ncbi:MAG: invasion associated locus B family protein [Castellaniella sp.]|uniref:invasion associated locus B family protein n=1 Tax=Castellaniella sp. TaxID=1955812 RepID=UPI003A840FBA
MRYSSGLWLVAILSLASPTVSAQTQKGAAKEASASKPAPAAPVPATPTVTTASFGDWILRCQRIGEPSRKLCEVVYMITIQGKTNPIAQVAIGKSQSGGSERLTVVVPPNIVIGAKPQVMIKAKATPIELAWQRCLPGACFASSEISNATISELAAQSEPGKIMFKDAADREITLPLASRGLSQALAALAKEQ